MTSVGLACTSLRCLLQISKTTKGCLPGRIIGWRLTYVSKDRFNLPPTHNITLASTNGRSSRNLLLGGTSFPFRNTFSSLEYSVICTAANQRSSAAFNSLDFKGPLVLDSYLVRRIVINESQHPRGDSSKFGLTIYSFKERQV